MFTINRFCFSEEEEEEEDFEEEGLDDEDEDAEGKSGDQRIKKKVKRSKKQSECR